MSHHDHSHYISSTNARRVGIAAVLTGLFMIAEIIGGIVSGSLALLADAGHMLIDFISLALAWLGFKLARQPADFMRTYGFDRFSILVAFVNGLTLFGIAIWIVVEAWHRISQPAPILGGTMFWIALTGLVVNMVSFWILQGGDQENLNLRAAVLHVIGDVLGSVAAIIAAIVIIFTGWLPIDPILSVFVAFILLKSAWGVVRQSGHILLEGSPQGLDPRDIKSDLEALLPAVEDVHHIHTWSITQERPMVTLHVRANDTLQPDVLIATIKARLRDHFGVEHSTVELEQDRCADEAHDDEPTHSV
ncbi:MAG: cation transporter [Magnetovibrio sp.]|nr:cation transporter [Magnetovibrio sp.]